MRHVLKRNRGFIAIPAVLALTLAACDTDDDSPTIDEDAEDEQAALPSGIFGDDCQELIAGADVADADAGVDTDADAEADADADADADGLEGEGVDDEDDELGIALVAADDEDGGGTDDERTDDEADDVGEGDGLDDDADAGGAEDGVDTEGDAEGDAEADAEAEADVEADTDTDTDTDNDNDNDTTVTVDEQQLREMTTLEALEALPDLDTLTTELRGSQLATDLEQESEVTLFAATDEAFEDIDGTGGGTDGGDTEAGDDGLDAEDTDDTDATDDGVDGDATDDADLGTTTTVTIDDRVLAHHLHLDGALFAQDLVDQEDVSTAAEDAGDLRVTADGDDVSVEADESTAQVTCANIETQDGTIHVIDEVLVPREDTAATDEDTDADTDTEADTDAGTETDTDTDTDADADVDADAETDDG